MVTNLINLDQEREKRVVTLVIEGSEVDFEALKDFLDSLEVDDYEMRVDALTLAIGTLAEHSDYYGPAAVLKAAEEYYEFLKSEG